jgi:hypothetical protein
MKQLHYLLILLAVASTYVNGARDFEDQRMQLNIGPLFNYARYDLGCLPKIQGYLVGFHTDYIYRKNPGFYTELQFDGRWNAGYVSGNADTKVKIRDYRPEWLLGYDFSLSRDCTAYIAPLTGFGFYYLFNELQPDVMTYRYFNFYVPVGFEALWKVSEDCFDMGLRALYRVDVHTRLKLETPCFEECECETIKLKRSMGAHVEFPFTWYKSWDNRANWQIRLVPFFDWNRFGKADQANSNGICFDVPQLDSWYLGAHLDFGLRF